ncbi:MAG: transporter substrate-binding domain-containing protein [Waddliaceae bacterium]
MAFKKTKPFAVAFGALIVIVGLSWLLFRFASVVPEREKILYYIGRDSTWYPLDLRGRERSMAGFANDLFQAIALEEEFNVHIFEVGANALFDGLRLGRYDGVLSHLSSNVVNQRIYHFSDPFYLIGPVLIVPEDSPVQSLGDMEGKTIGIEAGSRQVFKIPEPPNVAFVPYDSAATALDNLDKHDIDGVILDALKAYAFTEGFYLGKLKVATSPLTGKGLRLITRKDPKSLLLISRFNKGLEKLKSEGVYEQLIKKWDLTDTEVREEKRDSTPKNESVNS